MLGQHIEGRGRRCHGHARHLHSAVGGVGDQSLTRQPPKRFAHWGLGYTPSGRHFFLSQVFPGTKIARHDGVVDGFIDDVRLCAARDALEGHDDKDTPLPCLMGAATTGLLQRSTV